jgi:putative PIN family toxin of toxin-antitoxin system
VRILLDTNLLVRAAITPDGLARKLLRCIEKGEEHVLIISSYLLGEVADVLHRPRIQAQWPISDQEIQVYCRSLSEVGEEVPVRPLAPVIRDSKDQAVIEAAVAGRANVICTGDAHFYLSPAKEFLEQHGISVVNDRGLLALFETEG